jgi:hypothetical protein
LKSNTENDQSLNANLRFFRNQIKSQPDGEFLNKLLQNYFYDYDLLEKKHNYIQWIFPLRVQGLNPYAQALQLHELEILKNDLCALNYLLRSTQMMLDFYGMRIVSVEPILVIRAKNYKERYENLKR